MLREVEVEMKSILLQRLHRLDDLRDVSSFQSILFFFFYLSRVEKVLSCIRTIDKRKKNSLSNNILMRISENTEEKLMFFHVSPRLWFVFHMVFDFFSFAHGCLKI